MPTILQQIESDLMFFRNLITILENDAQSTEYYLASAIQTSRDANLAEIKRLEIILESGIIPETYYSIVTKQIYYPSAEELEKMAESLPKTIHTFFAFKKSRKRDSVPHSVMTVVTDDFVPVLTFSMEHRVDKKYPKGTFAAKVKKGFVADVDEPKYAVKVYKNGLFPEQTDHELRIAMRSAYCYKILGRTGISFKTTTKQYTVTEWLSGSNLYQENKKFLQSMPIPLRIAMAISLLRELNILHKSGLLHCDIKPENVMVELGLLRFVDFDSVILKCELNTTRNKIIYTERFLPSPQMAYDAKHNARAFYAKINEQTDIFAMGLTLIHLFPEIYTPRKISKEITVKTVPVSVYKYDTFLVENSDQYATHPQLQNLLKKMIDVYPDTTMTVQQLISDFQQMLLTYPGQDPNMGGLDDLNVIYHPEDSVKAFKQIEMEVSEFDQRYAAVKQKFSM